MALPIAGLTTFISHFKDTSPSYEIDISISGCVSVGFLDFSDDEALSQSNKFHRIWIRSSYQQKLFRVEQNGNIT
jgi:hypothetical protein